MISSNSGNERVLYNYLREKRGRRRRRDELGGETVVEAEPAMAAAADGLHFSLSAFDLIFRKSILRCERLEIVCGSGVLQSRR